MSTNPAASRRGIARTVSASLIGMTLPISLYMPGICTITVIAVGLAGKTRGSSLETLKVDPRRRASTWNRTRGRRQ